MISPHGNQGRMDGVQFNKSLFPGTREYGARNLSSGQVVNASAFFVKSREERKVELREGGLPKTATSQVSQSVTQSVSQSVSHTSPLSIQYMGGAEPLIPSLRHTSYSVLTLSLSVQVSLAGWAFCRSGWHRT